MLINFKKKKQSITFRQSKNIKFEKGFKKNKDISFYSRKKPIGSMWGKQFKGMDELFHEIHSLQITIPPFPGLVYNYRGAHFVYTVKHMPLFVNQVKKFRKRPLVFKKFRKIIKLVNFENLEKKKKVRYLKKVTYIFFKLRTKKLIKFTRKSRYKLKKQQPFKYFYNIKNLDFRLKWKKQIFAKKYVNKNVRLHQKNLGFLYKKINWYLWKELKKKKRKKLGPRKPRNRIFELWVVRNKNKVMNFIN